MIYTYYFAKIYDEKQRKLNVNKSETILNICDVICVRVALDETMYVECMGHDKWNHLRE